MDYYSVYGCNDEGISEELALEQWIEYCEQKQNRTVALMILNSNSTNETGELEFDEF